MLVRRGGRSGVENVSRQRSCSLCHPACVCVHACASVCACVRVCLHALSVCEYYTFSVDCASLFSNIVVQV